MFDNEDMGSLTLRRVSRQTIDALYKAKSLTGLPICSLVDDIVRRWLNEPHGMMQLSLDHFRRVVDGLGVDGEESSHSDVVSSLPDHDT